MHEIIEKVYETNMIVPNFINMPPILKLHSRSKLKLLLLPAYSCRTDARGI